MTRHLLVYVHIPFCSSKCHFCDWVQEIPVAALRLSSGSTPRVRYLEAVKSQIQFFGPRLTDKGYVPTILYWGGGTATILKEDEIHQIMDALCASFDLDGLSEATIEGSPETLTRDKLCLFRHLGFRRVSIGLQSMNDARLRAIGRSHDSGVGATSVRLAKEAGFDDINIDLISGFPGESVAEFKASLRSTLELPINHVSLYPYRPAAGTTMRVQLRRGTIGKINLHEQLTAYDLGREMLEDAGLPEYAMAHFGQLKCQSDLAYFQLHMDWIGFGSGATSLIGKEFLATRRGQLECYISNPTGFDDAFPASAPRVTPRLMYQSLSTWEGAQSHFWEERTGLPLDQVLNQPEVRCLLDQVAQTAHLIRDNTGIRIKSEEVAGAFIRLLYTSAPHAAREQQFAESVLGAY